MSRDLTTATGGGIPCRAKVRLGQPPGGSGRSCWAAPKSVDSGGLGCHTPCNWLAVSPQVSIVHAEYLPQGVASREKTNQGYLSAIIHCTSPCAAGTGAEQRCGTCRYGTAPLESAQGGAAQVVCGEHDHDVCGGHAAAQRLLRWREPLGRELRQQHRD